MRLLDRILRDWRVAVAMRYMPKQVLSVFDIGCNDGYLLARLPLQVINRHGIDERLAEDTVVNGVTMYKGCFPGDRRVLGGAGQYDVIFAVAVFEHLSDADLTEAARVIPSMLAPGGRLIITVPHPFVDRILEALIFLRCLEGQATEEHHGFEPMDLIAHFGTALKLIVHKRFQLGLNNVFVFERSG